MNWLEIIVIGGEKRRLNLDMIKEMSISNDKLQVTFAGENPVSFGPRSSGANVMLEDGDWDKLKKQLG